MKLYLPPSIKFRPILAGKMHLKWHFSRINLNMASGYELSAFLAKEELLHSKLSKNKQTNKTCWEGWSQGGCCDSVVAE